MDAAAFVLAAAAAPAAPLRRLRVPACAGGDLGAALRAVAALTAPALLVMALEGVLVMAQAVAQAVALVGLGVGIAPAAVGPPVPWIDPVVSLVSRAVAVAATAALEARADEALADAAPETATPDTAATGDAARAANDNVAPAGESRICAPTMTRNCSACACPCARTTPDSEHSSVMASAL